jgi:hypothetical protein
MIEFITSCCQWWVGLCSNSGPRVSIYSGKTHPGASVLRNTTLSTISKIKVADKDLILACTTERTEPPSTSEEVRGTSFRCRPREVSRAWIDQAKRVVSRLVEAGGDRVGRQPPDGSVMQSTRNRVNVELQRFLANL